MDLLGLWAAELVNSGLSLGVRSLNTDLLDDLHVFVESSDVDRLDSQPVRWSVLHVVRSLDELHVRQLAALLISVEREVDPGASSSR